MSVDCMLKIVYNLINQSKEVIIMKEKSELALKLKMLRSQKGVSSETVSNAIGIKSATYRRYEINTMPKSETYVALAEYFGVSVDYLIGSKNSLGVKSSARYKASSRIGALSEEEQVFIRKLRSISHEDANDVAKYLTSKKSIM